MIVFCLLLPKKKFATLISTYTHTITKFDNVKDRFYEDLNDTISVMPRADKLIIIGHFNTHVGKDYMSWEGVIGKHGMDKCNSKSLSSRVLCCLWSSRHQHSLPSAQMQQDIMDALSADPKDVPPYHITKMETSV